MIETVNHLITQLNSYFSQFFSNLNLMISNLENAGFTDFEKRFISCFCPVEGIANLSYMYFTMIGIIFAIGVVKHAIQTVKR